MRKTAITIGPGDNGRHMSLAEFDNAEGQEGYIYELNRGVIVVSDVPNPPHLAQIDATRQQIEHYRWTHSGRIYRLAAGSECKLLVPDYGSERHPDIAIYKSPPRTGRDVWATWIPDILIEIVSASSKFRDYVLKREEYWKFGVREYWLLEAAIRELRVLKRGGDAWTERIIRPPKLYKTRLLPGFAFDCGLVFEAAESAGFQDGQES